MAVMERSELEASPLADLHAIADQVGLDGFRRLRKAELIDTIIERTGGDAGESRPAAPTPEPEQKEERAPGTRRRRAGRTRRGRATAEEPRPESARPEREDENDKDKEDKKGAAERQAEGVVELLGNGSAFLRVDPPEPSDSDVYISAAQVRRCELVSGDRVSGPVRTPRRSERYPSLARVDTINGASSETVSEGARYEDLAATHPTERLELDAADPTLKAIEWLTPIGRGSRALIVGAARAGKTEVLRRILGALAPREGLELTVVLAGVRPEEIADWEQVSPAPVAPTAALSFAASPDLQGQAVEHAIETAKRVAVRGANAVVLIDGLDGLHPHVARRALGAARNLTEGGSLTVIATATRPFGGESTVVALDVALTSTGRLPALDLVNSGTLRAELLVGEEEAQNITRARAEALAG
jgi:transcription termination factor Rho